MAKCIVCGRDIGILYKFPAGSIYLCSDKPCLDTLNFKLNRSVPVASFDILDLEEHELIDPKIIKKYRGNEKIIRKLGLVVEQYIWSGETLGEMFHEALGEAAGELEAFYIYKLPRKALPLISMHDDLRTNAGREALEHRLKN